MTTGPVFGRGQDTTGIVAFETLVAQEPYPSTKQVFSGGG
jgi:hypothetical protein